MWKQLRRMTLRPNIWRSARSNLSLLLPCWHPLPVQRFGLSISWMANYYKLSGRLSCQFNSWFLWNSWIINFPSDPVEITVLKSSKQTQLLICIYIKSACNLTFSQKLAKALKLRYSWSFTLLSTSHCNIEEYPQVTVVGAGPCGLRTAIEAQLLGARVTVIEKRTSFTRLIALQI